MEYKITNTHSIHRVYTNEQGQEIGFAPGETKKLKTLPPKRQGNWVIEALEQTSKPEDIENTMEVNN